MTTETQVASYRRALRLDANATVKDVHDHYRREMLRWHPDRPDGNSRRAALINEARDFFTEQPSRIAEPLRPAPRPVATAYPSPAPRVHTAPSPPTPGGPPASIHTAPAPIAQRPGRIGLGGVLVAGALLYLAVLGFAIIMWISTTVATLAG